MTATDRTTTMSSRVNLSGRTRLFSPKNILDVAPLRPWEMSYDENHNVVRPPPPPTMKRAPAKLGIVRLLCRKRREHGREHAIDSCKRRGIRKGSGRGDQTW